MARFALAARPVPLRPRGRRRTRGWQRFSAPKRHAVCLSEECPKTGCRPDSPRRLRSIIESKRKICRGHRDIFCQSSLTKKTWGMVPTSASLPISYPSAIAASFDDGCDGSSSLSFCDQNLFTSIPFLYFFPFFNISRRVFQLAEHIFPPYYF